MCSVRYRYARYRYRCRTKLTEVFGTGVDVLNLPKYLVPVLMLHRTYRSVRHGMKVCTGTGCTGIHIVQNLPLPVSISYRTYRSIWYRYGCRTELAEVCGTGIELTEVSGTGIDVGPSLPKGPVPVLMPYRTCRSVRYRY